jgi:twitching motility protein PilJ
MMTVQYQEALHSYSEGRYEEAMRQFSDLLYEDPRNPKLHIWLGAAFRKAGKIEYAKVQYQQVLTLTDDPDLLDLAKTSLAQIQNKLAGQSSANPQKSKKDSVNGSANLSADFHEFNGSSNGNSNGISNGSSNGRSNGLTFTNGDEVTLLAHPSIESQSNLTATSAVVAKSNGIGLVPPPPAIALTLKKQQEHSIADQQTLAYSQTLADSQEVPTSQVEQIFAFEDITAKADSSILKDAITKIENGVQKSSLNGNHHPNHHTNHGDNQNHKMVAKEQTQVVFSPLESHLFSEVAEDDTAIASQDVSDRVGQTPIALEDMFIFSTLRQKITLWGTLLATIPAIGLGIAAYHGGNELLLNKAKQKQQSDAIALAQVTGRFLRQQTTDVAVLQTLLVASEVGQNTLQQNAVQKPPSQSIAQQRQYKQLLTNRLSLYSQAYPQYASIAVFSSTGELIAQSTNSKTLQTLNLNPLNSNPQKGAGSVNDSVVISNPVIGKDGAVVYAVAAVKSSVSQKVNMVLQVEIPIKNLVTELTNTGIINSGEMENAKSYNFFVVDSNNKYVTSSQSVKIGEDALEDFTMLSDLRTSQSPALRNVVRGDRNQQILAYMPVNMLGWDLLTTIDKDQAVSGSQNLLLIIGVGIAATPLIVGAIAFALSQRLTKRLKEIRAALRFLRRALRRGDSDISFDPIFGRLNVDGNDELADISLSINRMSDQLQIMMKKQEQENQRLQLQAVKMFKVLSKLAREEKKEGQEPDLSDANILKLGKKVRAEMVQRNAEVNGYRQQQRELQGHLMQMLGNIKGLTNGDLTVSTKAPDGNLTDISVFFDDVICGLQNIVGEVKSSANQVNLALVENEQAIANLVVVSQRQVDMVDRSLHNAQMEQKSATVLTSNSRQIMKSSQLVAAKLSDSDRNLDAVLQQISGLQSTVTNTAKRVKHLGEVSQKVTQAISSINEIAIKTNFLAINATLESSRSENGHGGFVIVAEEVGELTARSVAATKEVENLLGNIQRETNEVMEAVELGSSQISQSNQLAIAAKDNLQQISQVSQQIDELMSSISEVTIAQVQTSENVANLMQDLSHIAHKTLSSSSEASRSLKSTRQYSGELRQSLSHFKTL